MNANIRLFNEAKLSQQLNLAPQLLNWLKLLQAPVSELSALVQSELLSNPALEVSEPARSDSEADYDYKNDEFTARETSFEEGTFGDRLNHLADIDRDWSEADAPRLATTSQLQERHDYQMDHLIRGRSLQDELFEVIAFSDLTEAESSLAEILTGCLDDRGYLALAEDELVATCGVSGVELETAIRLFQELAPCGIGARNLQECLLLQLAALPQDTSVAARLIADCADYLGQGVENVLAEHLGTTLSEVEAAMMLIRSLDPEPGRAYQDVAVEYVSADMEIAVEDGKLTVTLCDEQVPHLSLSRFCKNMMEARSGSKEDLEYMRRKVRDATFLIQGISQRQDTLLKVANQVLRVQREFLLSDQGQLQTLTMNKVAAIIGVHETTVSRAIANKYVRSPRGLIPMREFFKVGYRCADGSSVTPERVKEQMLAYIEEEEALNPLTDLQLTELFKEGGVKVARRTIAKYRDETGTPSSKQRKIEAKRRQKLQLEV